MLFYVLFVLYCSMYCLCVNVYCHRVTTQLQLTNISYHIIFFFTESWSAVQFSDPYCALYDREVCVEFIGT